MKLCWIKWHRYREKEICIVPNSSRISNTIYQLPPPFREVIKIVDNVLGSQQLYQNQTFIEKQIRQHRNSSTRIIVSSSTMLLESSSQSSKVTRSLAEEGGENCCKARRLTGRRTEFGAAQGEAELKSKIPNPYFPFCF